MQIALIILFFFKQIALNSENEHPKWSERPYLPGPKKVSNGCELVVLMPLYIVGSFLHFDSGSESKNIYLLAFPNFAKVLTEPVVSLLQGFNDVSIEQRWREGGGGVLPYMGYRYVPLLRVMVFEQFSLG